MKTEKELIVEFIEYFDKNFINLGYEGICSILVFFCFHKTKQEEVLLEDLIGRYIVKYSIITFNFGYFWRRFISIFTGEGYYWFKEGKKEPRMKYLNYILKQLEKNETNRRISTNA